MKVRRAGKRVEEKIELQMTPMIDIVFQLLVFFIMTFKIVAMEGDFNIRMPLSAPREGPPPDRDLPPMILRLSANSNGTLARLRLSEREFDGQTNKEKFEKLRAHIMNLLGDERGPGTKQAEAEVEINCDYNLHYRYVIDTITAITGHLGPDRQVIKLVEKIKFSPPKTPPGE